MSGIISAILYGVAITNAVLGLVIFSRGLRNPTNLLFGLIAVSTAIWSIAITGFYFIDFLSIEFNWVTVTHISALLVSYFFLVFSVFFPRHFLFSKLVLAGGTILTIFTLVLLSNTNLIVGRAAGLSYEIYSGYLLYAFVLLLNFVSGYFFLIKQYQETKDPTQKNQVVYVLSGSVIASTLAIIPDLIFPYFDIFSYTWLGPLFTLILVVSIFIAILKYQLFSIKVIVTEIFSALITIILIIDLVLSDSTTEVIIKTCILILISGLSFLLIRSVYKEVETREQIERLAKDLAAANERLKELDQLKSEFVSIASHQLRSPLTSIKGYASLIMDGSFGIVPKAINEAVDKIFASAEHLVLVVEDFLNVSRIEQGRMKYDFVETDIQKLVKEVVESQKPSALRAKLSLSFATDNKGPFKTSIDIGKIRQVITNLIDNSIKYTPSGKIEVMLERLGRQIRISVKDTGVGIDPVTLPQLFEKFTRAKDASKTNVSGTGLGLYVAKQMVEAHGGRIWAESSGRGKGSSFFVELKASI